MPRLRMSLSSLMVTVAVIALGLAGITSASRLWTVVAATATLALLLSAILASWLASGLERGFWAGFAVFGWTYLVLVNWDWVGGQFGHDLTPNLGAAAEWLIPEVRDPVMATLPMAPPAGPAPVGTAARSRIVPPALAPGAAAVSALRSDYYERAQERQIKIGNFVEIGRLVLALLFALLGGFIGRMLAERRDRPRGADL
jgi:hypothetical protein